MILISESKEDQVFQDSMKNNFNSGDGDSRKVLSNMISCLGLKVVSYSTCTMPFYRAPVPCSVLLKMKILI